MFPFLISSFLVLFIDFLNKLPVKLNFGLALFYLRSHLFYPPSDPSITRTLWPIPHLFCPKLWLDPSSYTELPPIPSPTSSLIFFFFFFLIPPGRPLGPREGYDNPQRGLSYACPQRGHAFTLVFFFRVASVVSLPAPVCTLRVLHIPSGDVYTFNACAYAYTFAILACLHAF